MRILAASVFLFLVITSCESGKNQALDETSITFKTDDSTKLFFKNLRQPYYSVEVMEEAKLEIYRLKSRIIESERPIINLSIVNNWRYDEAYVLIEPNTAAGNLTELYLKWNNPNGSSGEIKMDVQNKMSQVVFASKVYEQIKNGSEFSLIQNDKQIEMLNDTKSREAFRITMFDYFRLTSIN